MGGVSLRGTTVCAKAGPRHIRGDEVRGQDPRATSTGAALRAYGGEGAGCSSGSLPVLFTAFPFVEGMRGGAGVQTETTLWEGAFLALQRKCKRRLCLGQRETFPLSHPSPEVETLALLPQLRADHVAFRCIMSPSTSWGEPGFQLIEHRRGGSWLGAAWSQEAWALSADAG